MIIRDLLQSSDAYLDGDTRYSTAVESALNDDVGVSGDAAKFS